MNCEMFNSAEQSREGHSRIHARGDRRNRPKGRGQLLGRKGSGAVAEAGTLRQERMSGDDEKLYGNHVRPLSLWGRNFHGPKVERRAVRCPIK